jgi:hypothetical protein
MCVIFVICATFNFFFDFLMKAGMAKKRRNFENFSKTNLCLSLRNLDRFNNVAAFLMVSSYAEGKKKIKIHINNEVCKCIMKFEKYRYTQQMTSRFEPTTYITTLDKIFLQRLKYLFSIRCPQL